MLLFFCFPRAYIHRSDRVPESDRPRALVNSDDVLARQDFIARLSQAANL